MVTITDNGYVVGSVTTEHAARMLESATDRDAGTIANAFARGTAFVVGTLTFVPSV